MNRSKILSKIAEDIAMIRHRNAKDRNHATRHRRLSDPEYFRTVAQLWQFDRLGNNKSKTFEARAPTTAPSHKRVALF